MNKLAPIILAFQVYCRGIFSFTSNSQALSAVNYQMQQIYGPFPNTTLLFPPSNEDGYISQITPGVDTSFIYQGLYVPSLYFVVAFISNLYNSSSYPRSSDDPLYWTSSINQIAFYYNPNEIYSVQLSETTLKDTLMVYGDSNFTFSSLDISFNITDNATVLQFVQLWNQTLTAPVLDFGKFNAALTTLWQSNAIVYTSSSVSNLDGEFFGAVGSVNSAAIFRGKFTLSNAAFSNNDISTIGKFSNSSNFTFSEVSGLAIVNQQLHLSSKKGTIQFGSLNITQVQINSLSPSSGSIDFIGASNFAVGYIPQSLDVLKFIPYLIPILIVIAIFALIAIRYSLKRLENRAGRDIQLGNLANPSEQADCFISNFPPNTQAANLALNSNNSIPTSMSDPGNSVTMLTIRKFVGFGFQGVKPRVIISKMENGQQEIEFNTYQECNIQSNACLKPRIFGSESPQPPPSFDTFGASQECYFEVKILSKDKENAKIALGFATCPYPPFRLPGYDQTSIAYHSDSGNVFWNNRENGTTCGPPIAVGDVLGIGYRIVEIPSYGDHILNQTVFYFTHNGIRIGDEFVTDGFYPDQIYPTLGTTGSCKLQAVFGPVDLVFNAPTVFVVDETITEVDTGLPTDQATIVVSANEPGHPPLPMRPLQAENEGIRLVHSNEQVNVQPADNTASIGNISEHQSSDAVPEYVLNINTTRYHDFSTDSQSANSAQIVLKLNE
ncbi:Rsp5p-dependent ubiquitination, sorting of cargo proteins at the multivesicular body [Terramyces sp. JEL0728]|nr:Rsp5p-dependent ubiquitination, sorting of cargo proteins at the multivesicular body [Terramyces sp. JEL0728]